MAGGIADEVEQVWAKMVETVLKEANHKDLGTLSPLLVSALSNTNNNILNLAVEYWNSNLSAGVDKSALPVALQYCLKKLSKRVHINSLQAADDTQGSGSPTSNDEGQMDLNSQPWGKHEPISKRTVNRQTQNLRWLPRCFFVFLGLPRHQCEH